MTLYGSELLTAGLGVGKLSLVCTACYAVYLRHGQTFAEAVASGIISSLMIFSFIFQVSMILNWPGLSWIFEWGLSIFSVVLAYKYRRSLKKGLKKIRFFVSGYPAISIMLLLCWLFLLAHAIFFPGMPARCPDLYHAFSQSGRDFFLPATNPGLNTAQYSWPGSMNATALCCMFPGKPPVTGAGFPGFLAYLSIGLSTYTLARRYAWPPTATLVALAIISMPRFIYLAVIPGPEVIHAAVALFCILMIYRGVEQPGIRKLYLLALGFFFLMMETPATLVFSFILASLSCVVLFRRHGAGTWYRLMARHKWVLLSMALPVIVFSQAWYLAHHLFLPENDRFTNTITELAMNHDGIQGSLANMARYILEMAHFTRPVDNLIQFLAGFRITELTQGIYDIAIFPGFENRGSADVFKIQWVPNDKLSWFGPFGFILVLPAMGYTLKLAPRRLKAVTLALLFYFFLIALILAWSPSNVRYFSIFFSCAGFCTAFFLPPWRLTRCGRRAVALICMGLMVYACIQI